MMCRERERLKGVKKCLCQRNFGSNSSESRDLLSWEEKCAIRVTQWTKSWKNSALSNVCIPTVICKITSRKTFNQHFFENKHFFPNFLAYCIASQSSLLLGRVPNSITPLWVFKVTIDRKFKTFRKVGFSQVFVFFLLSSSCSILYILLW